MRRRLRSPRVAIVDLGCAKNTVDSETALGQLLSEEFRFTERPQDADVVLVNTCGFIESAKQESVDHLLEAVGWKEERPDLKVVAMGCLAQRYGQALAQDIPELDAVIGLAGACQIVDVCRRVLVGKRVHRYASTKSPSLRQGPRLLLTGQASAYLRIAEGCDNRCAYCAVPFIRGPYHSRAAADIVREAAELVDRGVRELCLVAQDTTYYGAERHGRPRLAGLLRKLLRVPGAPWIRVLYAHPARVSDELIALLGGEERLLGYLDLPIQHSETSILRRMGRGVTRRELEGLLGRLRARVPKLVVRTSLIAGFPGETDRDFERLVEFVRAGHFEHLGAFAYSREENTRAARMPGQIPKSEAERRAEVLLRAQQPVTFQWLEGRVGMCETVLVEGADPQGRAVGRSRAEAPEVDGCITLNRGGFLAGARIEACVAARNGYDLTALVQPG